MKKLSDSNKNICEYILNDYITGMELDETKEMIQKLPLLVDNNLACCISGKEDLYFNTIGIYRVASKFIQKYNKEIKDCRRKLDDYEYGGAENTKASDDKRLIKLSQSSLSAGTYFAQLDTNHYCVFIVSVEHEDYDMVSYKLYFIGKKWKKWSDKFYKLYDEYKDISNKDKDQIIMYSDGRTSTQTIFKPFSQCVIRNKEDILRYIDNWVNNIPKYYDDYKMISKLSIMLYGSPGTGKSTFAKAVADYLNISTVMSISPDYFSTDKENRRGLGRIPCVYSLDDIDCVCKSRELDDSKENSETLSNLLSFLDNPPTFNYKAKNGVRYPISIVIASTNYYDRLDDAVKRYGRFDLKIEMNDFNKKEAQEMCDIYNLKLEDIVEGSDKKNFTISPSYLQALCLENLDKSMKEIK